MGVSLSLMWEAQGYAVRRWTLWGPEGQEAPAR